VASNGFAEVGARGDGRLPLKIGNKLDGGAPKGGEGADDMTSPGKLVIDL
jgi:hypothetical protein